MTMTATHQTDELSDAVTELDRLAEAAASEETQQAQAEADAQQGEWEDVDALDEQAAALAKLAVQGVELAAGLINPGHALDGQTRAAGEVVMLPVARDFAGEVPEWMRPYMHYLAAGLWMGGVMIGAYKARQVADAEAKAKAKKDQPAQGAAHGVQS